MEKQEVSRVDMMIPLTRNLSQVPVIWLRHFPFWPYLNSIHVNQ